MTEAEKGRVAKRRLWGEEFFYPQKECVRNFLTAVSINTSEFKIFYSFNLWTSCDLFGHVRITLSTRANASLILRLDL